MSDYLSALVKKNLSPQENLRPRPRLRFEPPARDSLGLDLTETEQAESSPRLDPFSASTNDSSSYQFDPTSKLESQQPASDMDLTSLHKGSLVSNQAFSGAQKDEPQLDSFLDRVYRGRMDPPSQVRTGDPSQPQENDPATQPATANRQVFFASDPEPAVGTLLPHDRPMPAAPVIAAQQAGTPDSSLDSSPVIREIRIERTVEHSLAPVIQAVPEAKRPRDYTPDSTRPLPTPAPKPPIRKPGQPELTSSTSLQPVPAPFPDLRVQNPAPAPAPTVNVTIGRIEIRAVPSAITPPRRPAPQPKLMSLDDYLQSRNNGGRR